MFEMWTEYLMMNFFQLDPFWWERHENGAKLVTVPLSPPSSSTLPLPPSMPRCMHACCRFSMFHHIIHIISLHTHIYQFLQFHSHVMVDSCVSALLPLQTKNKNLYYTPQTPYIDSCMNFALSTNLPLVLHTVYTEQYHFEWCQSIVFRFHTLHSYQQCTNRIGGRWTERMLGCVYVSLVFSILTRKMKLNSTDNSIHILTEKYTLKADITVFYMVEKLTTYELPSLSLCMRLCVWVMFLHTHKNMQHTMSDVFVPSSTSSSCVLD